VINVSRPHSPSQPPSATSDSSPYRDRKLLYADCTTSSGSTFSFRRPCKCVRARPISRRLKCSKAALGSESGASKTGRVKPSGDMANSHGYWSLDQFRGRGWRIVLRFFGRFCRPAGLHDYSRIRQTLAACCAVIHSAFAREMLQQPQITRRVKIPRRTQTPRQLKSSRRIAISTPSVLEKTGF